MTRLGALITVIAALLAGSAGAVVAEASSLHRAGRGPASSPGTRSREVSGAVRGSRRELGAHPCVRAATHARGAGDRCNSRVQQPARTKTRGPRRAAAGRQGGAGAAETAANQAGTIAKALAVPCQNAELIPEAGNLGLIKAAVLCLINTERAQNGREPLRPSAQLEQAAEGHGLEMISVDYFDHVAPSGVTPVQRIESTGYVPSSAGYVIGENLAWGTYSLATPQAIVSAWIASPEHLANILEGKYRDTGIDVRPEEPADLAEGAPGALYTQEFGTIVH